MLNNSNAYTKYILCSIYVSSISNYVKCFSNYVKCVFLFILFASMQYYLGVSDDNKFNLLPRL